MSDDIERRIAALNPLFVSAIESVTGEIARAFGEMWLRPDGPALMEGFLSDRIAFQIDRGGLLIARRPDAPADDGLSGPYL